MTAAKKAAPKTAQPRKAAKAAPLPTELTPEDREWTAGHMALAGASDALDAAVAETEAEDAPQAEDEDPPQDAPPGSFRMRLRGRTIWVKPLHKWPSSAMTDLNSYQNDRWARKALVDSSIRIWVEIDPLGEEVAEMISDWENEVSANLEKAQASRRSSLSMNRR